MLKGKEGCGQQTMLIRNRNKQFRFLINFSFHFSPSRVNNNKKEFSYKIFCVGHHLPNGWQWPTQLPVHTPLLEPSSETSAPGSPAWTAAAGSAATAPTAPSPTERETSTAAAGNQLNPLWIRFRHSLRSPVSGAESLSLLHGDESRCQLLVEAWRGWTGSVYILSSRSSNRLFGSTTRTCTSRSL